MNNIQARKIHVKGIVQGVGFRPFVFQLAQKYNLNGWVRNTSGDVSILVEGEESKLLDFISELKKGPSQSYIESISISQPALSKLPPFEIKKSLSIEHAYQMISPDLATCPECLKEIFNSSNRRYRYPFTNCTNCGPRFTIIQDIPYDRQLTTMSSFTMCPACQKEYNDPLDRRFHAQPNACPDCGPKLMLMDAAGKTIETEDVVIAASELLKKGKILAVKGLGGFLLACDATADESLCNLRLRKKRPAKPFAIMVADLDQAERYAYLTYREREILQSPASPIVLVRVRTGSLLSGQVAPGLSYLGIMLPYTPLHHLLIRETGLPLVMTSGNLTEEPIAAGNQEALALLQGIADYFVMNNRDIYSRYDDSVVMVEKENPQVIRRARGFAPMPINLPFVLTPLLACGAEQKNTFCLTHDNHALISQHIGDMQNEETLDHFESTQNLFARLFRIRPEIIACDLHPDYLSTKWAQAEAQKRKVPLIQVQHHHAHIVSCLADNSADGPVIGVAFDGSGYGPDGRVWGGEFMIAGSSDFQRRAHFEYLPLAGGELAVRKPSRIAIGYIYSLLGSEMLSGGLPCLKDVEETEIELIKQQIEQNINTPWTSSCGRLFDAVASLAGLRQEVEYEGQAAIELEMAAGDQRTDLFYPFKIEKQNEIEIVKVRDMLAAIINDIERSAPLALISARFHSTLTQIVSRICLDLSRETGIKQVALSGGVFQNRRLLNEISSSLRNNGLIPLLHSRVPCNDGGISLGQAVIANFTKVRD